MIRVSSIKNLIHLFITFLVLFLASNIYADEKNVDNVNSIDFKEIFKFAELANIAYSEKAQVKQKVEEYGYIVTTYQNIPGEEVTFFLLTNDKLHEQIIVTRGTANLENAIVDMAFNLIPNQHLGISLHNGFSSSATKIYQLVKPSLKKDYDIHTTGHSLGGAIAVILAMFLSDDNYKIKNVITFGQPKVTNITGINKYNQLNVIRIVSEKDVVPLVPPLDITDIYNIKFYWHQGTEIILTGNNQFARLQGIKSMLRATSFLTTQFSKEQIQQHSMENYLTVLKQVKKQPVEITLDTNINPLKLLGLGNN